MSPLRSRRPRRSPKFRVAVSSFRRTFILADDDLACSEVRVAVVGDIHANFGALEAVLRDATDVEDIWCLGDIVGYGPEPAACLERVARQCSITLLGNHDAAVVGTLSLSTFNGAAKEAAQWTRGQLDQSAMLFLRSLAPVHHRRPVSLVHGSLRDSLWEYLLSDEAACATFTRMPGHLCLVGHTHVPLWVEEDRSGVALSRAIENGVPRELPARRIIVNPGSVGQPRDRDPRAAYGVLVLDGVRPVSFEHRRVPYDIGSTQARMHAIGLPEELISRLSVGR